MSIRMMVLNDKETCTSFEGCAVVEFDNDEDSDLFAEQGRTPFDMLYTGLTTEVPVLKAKRKKDEEADEIW